MYTITKYVDVCPGPPISHQDNKAENNQNDMLFIET